MTAWDRDPRVIVVGGDDIAAEVTLILHENLSDRYVLWLLGVA